MDDMDVKSEGYGDEFYSQVTTAQASESEGSGTSQGNIELPETTSENHFKIKKVKPLRGWKLVAGIVLLIIVIVYCAGNVYNKLAGPLKDLDRQQRAYAEMSIAEMSKLPDDELYEAALARINIEYPQNDSPDELTFAKSLSHEKMVFYAVANYEIEMNNGGLMQFFMNPSGELCPILSDSMAEIKATEHKKLFDDFVEKYEIDFDNLQAIMIEDSEKAGDIGELDNIDEIPDFNKTNPVDELLPYDDFDSEFTALTPLQSNLVEYVRENINKF